MSSTRGGKDPTDLFVTPAWAVDAILPHLPIGGVVVDAGCGEGDILLRLQGAGQLHGVEIDPERADICRRRVQTMPRVPRIHTANFLTWYDVGADLVISNPAFGISELSFEHSIELTRDRGGTVAMLLRYDWGTPKMRLPFMKRHTPDVGWLYRRPPFAASLKCKGFRSPKAPPCGWKLMQRLTDQRPKVCPVCDGAISVVTTDSSNYGWFIVGPGRRGVHFPLEIPARDAEAA